MKTTHYLHYVLLSLALGLSGCGQKEEDSDLKGYIDSYDVVWSSKSIKVCWEPDSSSSKSLSQGKAAVKSAVTQEYSKVGFNLYGWGTCTSSDTGSIRIWVDDDVWPYVKDFGKDLAGVRDGLNLTFAFSSAGAGGWGELCQGETRRIRCIKNYALHEFGHALGLKHEADRNDSSCEQQTNSAGIHIGTYDSLSIMNYCNNESDVRANREPVLSSGDISTLHHAYHRGSKSVRYGSIAYSTSSKAAGWSWDFNNRSAAEYAALSNCQMQRGNPSTCKVIAWASDSCLSLASGKNGGYGWARRSTSSAARSAALENCKKYDSDCRTRTSFCADQ